MPDPKPENGVRSCTTLGKKEPHGACPWEIVRGFVSGISGIPKGGMVGFGKVLAVIVIVMTMRYQNTNDNGSAYKCSYGNLIGANDSNQNMVGAARVTRQFPHSKCDYCP